MQLKNEKLFGSCVFGWVGLLLKYRETCNFVEALELEHLEPGSPVLVGQLVLLLLLLLPSVTHNLWTASPPAGLNQAILEGLDKHKFATRSFIKHELIIYAPFHIN